jgi:uroporphyrinogen III methyltransferase/synthase
MKILITRPRNQADSFAETLSAAGFKPVYFPVIEIRPFEENFALDRAIARLGCYDWVIFTSVNGVEAFFEHMSPRHHGDVGVKFAAIGPKTAQALESRGVHPDFVPKEYVAEAILPGLGDLRGRWVLLPRAEIARKALPESIAAAGGIPHEIAVYRTVLAEPDPDGLARLRSGVDAITFTSPSTVRSFVEIVHREGIDPLHLPNNPIIVCIGPITQKAAEEAGFSSSIVAEEYTMEGLLAAIKQNNR